MRKDRQDTLIGNRILIPLHISHFHKIGYGLYHVALTIGSSMAFGLFNHQLNGFAIVLVFNALVRIS
jgi:hypothetical protein